MSKNSKPPKNTRKENNIIQSKTKSLTEAELKEENERLKEITG